MNIDNLASLVGQNELYSNGSATISKGERIDPDGYQGSVMASAIYHGSKETPFDGYQRPAGHVITIKGYASESEAVREARIEARGWRLPNELAINSASLMRSFDQVADSLSPVLMNKDWGFSVADGELVILEGSDALSDSERTMIESALSRFGVDYSAKHLASDFVDNLNDARRPHGGESGILKYDLTEENFAEIIDLRTYLDSHDEDGTFERKFETLNDKSNLRSLFFLSGLNAMYDQMSARAEPKYADHAEPIFVDHF